MGTHDAPVADRVAEYLAQAMEARRMAARAHDLQMRAQFQKLAEGWEHLAQQVGKTQHSA